MFKPCIKRFLALFLVLCFFSSIPVSAAEMTWEGIVGPVSYNDLKFMCNNANGFPRFHNYEIAYDSSVSRWRIRDKDTGAWVVKSDGSYPYTVAEGDVPAEPGNAPADTPGPPSKTGNKFVDARAVDFNKAIVISYSALSAAVLLINEDGISSTIASNGPNANPYYIRTAGQSSSSYGIFCNSAGLPYISSGPTAPSVVDNDFNVIVDNSKNNSDNIVVNDTKVIDTSNNTMTVINENGDKVTYNIDSLYWDASTHSYTANTYNIVNNTYNYYTWNITYNITNTYINYIGSNDAYQQEEYKYYYELPDGRSSEDLTADEVGAMSFQFADVKNYARSATDTSLRALYHFDGNTEDSGYFSTQTSFKWINNASISYMDSASFNGALYLDERSHDFDIELPSNFGSGDFSVQWRHYQASQPDTVDNINNRIAIGGKTVLRWDEQRFYWGASGTTTSATIPIGNWHELALVRNDGVLYFYVNGLKVFSSADTYGYAGSLMFCFGATSRAYTMLDELRVVNFAIAKTGASYQCATVPYDTNLVLVLPDSAFPIADEYWKFNSTGNMISGFDFTTGLIPSVWKVGSYNSYSASVSAPADYLSISHNLSSSSYDSIIRSKSLTYVNYHMGISLYYPVATALTNTNQIYTFSVLDVDGNLYSVSFSPSSSDKFLATTLYSWGALSVVSTSAYNYNLCIIAAPDKSVSIRYAELVQGSVPNTGHEKISCIYSSDDIQPNTAAVQSEIPVTGYTVGGVRPTFPARGNVWFPVEGRRITGCYIYDGSMWRVAGCRYYTGTRWIPIYAFDIYTLADCWDVADAVDTTPPITTETGFWNWFKAQWTDFRKWGDTSVEAIIQAIAAVGSGVTEPDENCVHTYHYKDITPATCTAKGTRLFTCTKCGDTYTEEIPALGHDWIQIDDVQDVLDEDGNVIEKGYALWECTRCKIQHKDYERTGPPPDEGDSTITTLLNNLFDKLGSLGGDLLDWLFELATEAMDGLGNIGDYFDEKAQEVEGFGGGFLLFLAAAFDIIPPELMTALSLMILFLVLGLFVKQVLLK